MFHIPEIVQGASLRAGDFVAIGDAHRIHYQAQVEDAMPDREILWIRDLTTGERKLLVSTEHHFYQPLNT
jgi:hypothetical protein